MAGKKNRKRQTGSKKKVSKQNENDGSVSVEEKKPKLDEGLDEQSDNREQQPNLESPTVADTNNDLRVMVRDSEVLQSEDSKYVPPFTGKSKKTLQRHRLSSVSPDVKSARPKRPWKRKQSPADQQTNDMICGKGSPKMREEEKEQDMDVEGLEEVMIRTQENKDPAVFSTSQNSADELAVTTDEVISSSTLANGQEETSNIVMLVIDNVFEAMHKQITQCNSSEITSEFKEEPKTSAEETETHSIVNIDIQVTDSSKEIDVISEEELKPSIDTAVKPVTILTKAALKKTFTGKTASKIVKRCKAMAGSKSQTTLKQQQQNQATTNEQQHTTVGGHVHSTQETATSESALKTYDTGIINRADETLENESKGKLPCSPHQNENKKRVKQQGNSKTDREPGSQNYTVTSGGEISANDSNAEPKNLGIEGSPITTLEEVKDAVSFNNVITSVNEELYTLSTSPIPTNKDPSSTDICSANHFSEKEHHQQRASDDMLKSDEQTEMAHKSNMDTPILEREVSCTVYSGNCGVNANNMCQTDIDQDLDQMVPDNCETTTVMLQKNPDVESLTRDPKRKEIDLGDSGGVCSEQQHSPHFGEREHECHDLDEQMDKIPIAKTGTTRKMNESCQESPQLLKSSIAQASDVFVNQEPVTHELLTMEKTETCTESLLQSESFCKHVMETVDQDQKMENEITENQSSKVEAGCSLFGFDGDIMAFDSLMDCTDSQLVHVDDSSDENLLPESYKHDARQLLNSNGAESSTSNGNHCSVDVPSDKGMIKGLISELSALNKFIMGAWKDLENQKKRRQARLKLGKMKKLK